MAAGMSARTGVSRGRTLIYLARHGQTPLNESGVLRGLADPQLDETGRDQARRLGEALGPRELLAVVASPLLRAKETAALLFSHQPITLEPRLVEMDFGAWEMQPWDAIPRDQIDAWAADPAHTVVQQDRMTYITKMGSNSFRGALTCS